jgi:uncharacterized protein (DUF1499 family)
MRDCQFVSLTLPESDDGVNRKEEEKIRNKRRETTM